MQWTERVWTPPPQVTVHCCHGDEYQLATAMLYTGQVLWLQASSSSRLGFLMLRHLRSGNVISFPCKVFSTHFSSLFLTPKPQVAEHSLHAEAIHWSLLFLGHRPSTQPSCASGLGLLEHRLSGSVSAAGLLQRTSRLLTPRPQVLEH